MPKLYIANTTNQIQQFTYWIPESTRHTVQDIQIGGQILVAGRDLSNEFIDNIINQNRVYGLSTVAEAMRNPNFNGLVYAIDKPVSFVSLNELAHHRQMILVERGKRLRQEAALATDSSIYDMMQQQQLPGRLNKLEMSVEEVERDKRDDSPEISEGVRIDHAPNAPADTPSRRGKARAAARRASSG